MDPKALPGVNSEVADPSNAVEPSRKAEAATKAQPDADFEGSRPETASNSNKFSGSGSNNEDARPGNQLYRRFQYAYPSYTGTYCNFFNALGIVLHCDDAGRHVPNDCMDAFTNAAHECSFWPGKHTMSILRSSQEYAIMAVGMFPHEVVLYDLIHEYRNGEMREFFRAFDRSWDGRWGLAVENADYYY
ncbi:hypothetical protein PVAG01_03794 [Phlyctema vagabunda]|uniref:Uncharacterized protein n=1 Tax=Phlyctema vagabunda TaxID=108571 RepID=A0ABR4PME7_9HELO